MLAAPTCAQAAPVLPYSRQSERAKSRTLAKPSVCESIMLLVIYTEFCSMEAEHLKYHCKYKIWGWGNQQGLWLLSEEASDNTVELPWQRPAGGSRDTWYKVTNEESNQSMCQLLLSDARKNLNSFTSNKKNKTVESDVNITFAGSPGFPLLLQ